MTYSRREFTHLAVFGAAATALGMAAPTATAATASATTTAATPAAAGSDVPWGGPLAPDKPLAKAYDTAAKALSEVDDNPVIRWQYRVWCQTGYRGIGDAGTGQPVDALPDPTKDFVSPNGFLYKNHIRPMPAGGVQFLDNAWYFGTDFTGLVIVRTPDGGLVMLDSLTTPDDMRTQFLDQASAAGLDPRRIRYVFIGHRHVDHTGGANLIRDRYAPTAKFVMGQPDAQYVAKARAELRAHRDEYTKEEYKAKLAVLPSRIDIQIKAYPGHTVGMERIEIAPGTAAVAALAPGHTEGQMTVIVPVEHRGKTSKVVVWSGNDNADAASQYAISSDFVQGLAAQEGADAFINTHAYQGAAFSHLRTLKADPSAPNPLLMGVAGVQRHIEIFGTAHRALAQRLLDGTWKAM
ncbi:MBL fold metallo-hydrolase [Streptomyces sp. 891-h]|uniref:MBL fold metallo-hydrolase n=1 Tax=Streptomyces sp. 891-h TaxID=2720714 RepID=UPI001FA9488D|nr:MBL fold metallo-hydrolase [Streptomyces sp. 891-h]UNZ18219.1 MBL fold metallo-hydrolase [Streptomyces sp. 891-h]